MLARAFITMYVAKHGRPASYEDGSGAATPPVASFLLLLSVRYQ
jgi:hypothetical protein